MPRILRLVAVGLPLLLGSIGAVLPWAVYWAMLAKVDGRPSAPISQISTRDIQAIWAASEPDLKPEQFNEISPYWMYSWLACALVPRSCRTLPAGVSRMAGFVALTHLRDGHFQGKGMGQWHLSAMCLTIWIQRNMSPTDTVNAYTEAKTHYQNRK